MIPSPISPPPHGAAWRFFLICAVCAPLDAGAAALFEDGLLGLTQAELREKLGPPAAVRDRKSALRVFHYYPLSDWENYFKRLVSPQNGEDVYNVTRGGYDIRYSFGYALDLNDMSENPTLYVNLVDVEFSPPIPIERIPSVVPEFKPPTESGAPAFRSNLWLLLFKGPPSPNARMIVREPARERYEWFLAFQLFSLQGLPDPLTLRAPVDRMEISTQSVQLVRQRQRSTHEPTLNPFSQEFADQPPPAPKQKPIPVPKYAD